MKVVSCCLPAFSQKRGWLKFFNFFFFTWKMNLSVGFSNYFLFLDISNLFNFTRKIAKNFFLWPKFSLSRGFYAYISFLFSSFFFCQINYFRGKGIIYFILEYFIYFSFHIFYVLLSLESRCKGKHYVENLVFILFQGFLNDGKLLKNFPSEFYRFSGKISIFNKLWLIFIKVI